MGSEKPGSDGEHRIQDELGTTDRADVFYENAMQHELTERMQSFVRDRKMFFLATADSNGETDCSPRLGPEGFVNVLEPGRICYPEYRGNGVQASLGNIDENPFATLTFIDWWETTVGLHVNGEARIRDEIPEATDPVGLDRTKVWVEIEIEEAYIHCAKHIPKLSIEEFNPWWGTDDPEEKQVGHFTDSQPARNSVGGR